MILECTRCEATVDAKEIGRYGYQEGDDEGPIGPPGEYIFLMCSKCQGPFIVDDCGYQEAYTMYPRQDAPSPNLPKPLQEAYGEALKCFKTKAFTATAIMCRKTLEGICAEHGTTGKSLVSSLKELKDRGVIENRLFEWSDSLRIFGNEAAHDVNVTISRTDAKDILEFTHALLEYLFTFRDRFERFKERRSSANKKA